MFGEPHRVVAGAFHYFDSLERALIDRLDSDTPLWPTEELKNACFHRLVLSTCTSANWRPIAWRSAVCPFFGPGSKWALWRFSGLCGSAQVLNREAWRRKGPGGPTGLQIPFCTPQQITQGSVASKIVDFSAANATLYYL